MRRLCVSLLFAALLLSASLLNAQTVTFSKERGFYSATFSLTLTTDLSGATIKYTTNGTPPSASVGTTYSGAISISTTSVVRAIAIKGATVSKVFTHTYIFTNKVILQPINISGWPNNTYDLGSGSDNAVHDYQMDPDIVNNSAYNGQIQDGLKAIPTMSIVMDKALFWQVYDDPDGELEHPASIELLYANTPAQNEQFNAGLESHSHLRMKRSLKLDLHAPEFISKIFKYAPLNGNTATDDFSGNKIVLRGGNNDCWARNWLNGSTTYTRDEWYRASQHAVRGYASHGTFVHLYINGIYWGLYNPVERPDEGFTSEYLGGSTADWLSVNHDGIREGDPARYNYLIGNLVDKDMAVAANYNELKQYLDVEAFADYLNVSWILGMGDWPNNNYYGGNRNSPIQPFQYFAWDGEWSWTNQGTANNGAWVNPYFENSKSGGPIIANIWHSARDNSDFMMLFADRIYKNCFNGGPLTDANSRSRWATINNFISTAIIAESARWGDTDNPSDPRTKNDDWQPEVNRIDALMNGNVTRLINALKAEGYYPNLNPPNFNSEGGTVATNFQLTMTNPNGAGTIYYTTNGADPRLSGGALLAGALTYSSPVTITGTMTIKARIKNGNEWSALHEGTYTAGFNLKINEFSADNDNVVADERGDYEDWIEIFNNSPVAVNLGGMYLTNALSTPKKWQIPTANAAATTIPPYGFLLFWADQETSEGLLHTNFKLTKTGGQIGFYAPDGTGTLLLDSYSYTAQTTNVSKGRLPNGTGAFQSFTTPTPGESNEPGITRLFINEFLASNQTDTPDEFGQQDDWFEIYNDNTTPVNIGGLYVTDNLTLLTKYQIPTTNAVATTIPAKGFLLLWADEETTQGPLHVGIKLGNGGEQLGLVQYSGTTTRIIDSLTFGVQTANISRGRLPNGGSTFVNFTTTTPGASNVASGGTVDCNGVTNGTATLDDCNICSGGNTGHVANSDKDACGVCFGNGSTCNPPSCVQNEVVSFTLMRAGTASEIGPLTNGMIINKATIGSFSIRANVCSTSVGSVKFILNGSTLRTETALPYAINGDNSGSYIAWNPNVGSYTLEGKPYTGGGGSGSAGISEIVSFSVINQTGGTPDCNGVAGGTAALDDCGICAGGNTGKIPNANKDCNGVCFGTAVIDGCNICSGGNTGHVANSDKDACGICFGNGSTCNPPSCVQNEVVSFTLMHAGTAGEIGPLTNGMVINKSLTGPFSIRANTCTGTTGSVRFIVNNSTIRTETAPPYAIYGDTPAGNYTAWNPSPGSYTLIGKPYTGASGSGSSGISETVTFTVVNSASKMEDTEINAVENFTFSIYPNPNNGNFVIETYQETATNLEVRVFNALGQMVFQSPEQKASGNFSLSIEYPFAPGLYIVEMKTTVGFEREKMIVR